MELPRGLTPGLFSLQDSAKKGRKAFCFPSGVQTEKVRAGCRRQGIG
jgi:hypothetical protein